MYSLIFYAVICIPMANALSLFADDLLYESGDQVTLSQTQLTHLYTDKYMPSI